MRMVWGEVKRHENARKRGLDFADLEYDFDWEGALYLPTHPGKDGRPRIQAIGQMGAWLVSVVYAPWGTEAISIISMRRASRKERRSYDQR